MQPHQQAHIQASYASRNLRLGFLIRAIFGTASSYALIYPDLQWILHIHLEIGFMSTRLLFIPLKSVVKNCLCSCFAQELRAESVHLAAPKI